MKSLVVHSRLARVISWHLTSLAVPAIVLGLSGCAVIGPIYVHFYNRGPLRWEPMLVDGSRVQFLVPQGGTKTREDTGRGTHGRYDNPLFVHWSGATSGSYPASILMREYIFLGALPREVSAQTSGVHWQVKSTKSGDKDVLWSERDRYAWIPCADGKLAIQLYLLTSVRCSARTGKPAFPDEVPRFSIDDGIFRTILESIRIRGADGQYHAPTFDPPLPPTGLGDVPPQSVDDVMKALPPK